jgi:hypothetical protein
MAGDLADRLTGFPETSWRIVRRCGSARALKRGVGFTASRL